LAGRLEIVVHNERQRDVGDQGRMVSPEIVQAGSVTGKRVGAFLEVLSVSNRRDSPGQGFVTCRIVAAHLVLHAMDDGNFVHDPGRARQVFADLQTGH
tara:strand:- start:508 stop:801 length:294 start_codon:yes stop_codon:yes gene_type:complete